MDTDHLTPRNHSCNSMNASNEYEFKDTVSESLTVLLTVEHLSQSTLLSCKDDRRLQW